MSQNVAPLPAQQSRISLVVVLAVALFAELWLNRITARMARLDPASAVASFYKHLDLPALFSFELCSVLAAALLIGALGRVVLSKAERGPVRLSFAMVGGVASVLVLLGCVVHLPARFAAHLVLSAMFLLLVIALAFLAAPASRRLRAGAIVLMVPVGLMLAANLVQRFSAPGVLDPTASVLAELAGGALVMAGLLAPFLLAADTGPQPFAFALAAIVAGVGVALGRLDWDLAAQLAGIGFGVSIPTGAVGMPLYVLGGAGFTYAIATLLPLRGPERLRGMGLLIVCLVGVQLELPYQIAASLIGILCILDSSMRPAENAITRAQLDEIVKHVAALVGAAHVTVAGDLGRERARMSFTAASELPATLHIDRRASAVSAIEISVGVIADRAPPFTLATRRGRSLGPAANGPVVETDDREFDARFIVRDHRSAGSKLLDEDVRAKLLRFVDGWIGVWPQRGARFRARMIPTGDENLVTVTQLLADLVARSAT